MSSIKNKCPNCSGIRRPKRSKGLAQEKVRRSQALIPSSGFDLFSKKLGSL